MPTMANVTVKKYDGTTDIVYNALSGSGGDGSPAVWRQDTGAPAAQPVGLRKVFKLWSQWNGPKTARQSKFNYVAPYVLLDTTTSAYSSKDRVVIDGIATIPQGIPPSEINEAVSQAFNLLAAQLIKESVAAGYAAT